MIDSANIQSVGFHGHTLFITTHDDQPYVPMKPIVEGMGLNWKSQYRRLMEDRGHDDHSSRDGHNDHPLGRWGVCVIHTPSSGGDQKTLCMPLRKLPGWLMTLQPSRVAADKRDRIIQYQNECDDVLWAHWQQQTAPLPATVPVLTPPPHSAAHTITLQKDDYIALLEDTVKLARSRMAKSKFIRQELRQEIGELRQDGFSIGEIAGRLRRSQDFVMDVCLEEGWA